MPQKQTNPRANGPTITTITFVGNEVENALLDYAEIANGEALPAGPVRVIEIKRNKAVIEIRTPPSP